MAAATSDPSTTPLYFTEPGTGELKLRRWCVRVVAGPDTGKSLVRESGSVVVGTVAGADLVLSDSAVSRHHLELRLLAEGVLAVDLGSTNGMKVGGVKVDRALLGPEGQVRIGRTTIAVEPLESSAEHALSGTKNFGDFVSAAPQLQKILTRVAIVARTEATVLIEGETGTGKELIARAIHASSSRAQGPFIVVDCGAVHQGVLESELFGHQKGAFTSAIAERLGAFEAAHSGTIFLDELGELPLDLQPKLLRVLEARTVRRVGDHVDRPIDVRFVAATNRDLDVMRKEKRFRDDLYYRVAVVRARIPPLRERPADVPLLAQLYAAKLGGGQVELSAPALSALTLYEWPGNARELRNVIERAVALAQSRTIGPDELFPDASADAAPQASPTFREAKDQMIAEFEIRYAKMLIEKHQGNVSAAAREAGLSRTALYALLKRAGLEP